MSVAKTCFWPSWLVFIIIGLNQVHPDIFTLSEFSMKSVDYLQVFTIALCACLLILSEKHIVNFFGILSDFFKPIFGSKDNLTIKLIMRFAWIPILGGFILVLASLGTLGGKIVFTLLILLMGWLLSNVLRQAILSLIEPFGVKNKLWSKFFGYFVFVHFLIAAIYLWG